MSKIMELANELLRAFATDPVGKFPSAERVLQAEVSRMERELSSEKFERGVIEGRYDAVRAELAALKAEKVEREKQDYAAYVNDEGFIVERDLSISPGEKLYLAPGAGKPSGEPKLSEIFCGVDFSGGLLTVSVLRRRPDAVAELLHCEQLELPKERPAPGAGSVPLTNVDLLDMWKDATYKAMREDEGEAHEFYARAIEARIFGDVK
jgi:hypothetical protein